MAKPRKSRIEKIAQSQFGYEQFRPGQQAAIQSIVEGHDTLAVMPTGSGKSAIYQIAGLMIPGATVISLRDSLEREAAALQRVSG